MLIFLKIYIESRTGGAANMRIESTMTVESCTRPKILSSLGNRTICSSERDKTQLSAKLKVRK